MTRAQRRAHAAIWIALTLALAALAAHALARRAIVARVTSVEEPAR